MTDSHLYELEDVWNNAFAALGRIKLTTDKNGKFDGGTAADPDPVPIVALLRSDTLMPPGARDTLAELLSPGDPPIMNWRLVPEVLKKVDPLAEQISAVAAFAQNRASGMTVENAARQTGIRGDRQVHRYRNMLAALVRRLQGGGPNPH